MAATSRYVSRPAELDALVSDLRGLLAVDPRLAFDTEFIRERTYAPVLEIVQVATSDGLVAVIDVPGLQGDLGGLGELFLDDSVLKIVHSGGQDMEILGKRLGALPLPIFDTQVAAAFAGSGMQIGYGALVQNQLGVQLSKEEGFADWSRRPLTPSMLAYAENDVRYLHALHDKLARRLEQRGRAAWAEEQTMRVLGGAMDELPADELWRKVGGRTGMDGRALAVLRELAQWRDTEAQRRDKPRRSVVKDEVLVEIARRQPKSGHDVLALRSVQPSLGERNADALAECVRRGQAVPPDQRPRIESAPPLDEPGSALVELLSAVVRARAIEEDIPASLLATQEDLRNLAATRGRIDPSGPLFNGWRGRIVGDVLRGVVAGTVSVAWDSKRGKLVLAGP